MSTPAQTMMAERLKYPGMAPREVLIYNAWRKMHAAEYVRFDYNVRVGNGTDPGPAFPQVYRDQYIQNTQKRIDVIGWKVDTGTVVSTSSTPTTIEHFAAAGYVPFIIEVKDRATGSCMSQLLTYKTLFPITFPAARKAMLVLVTNRVSADMPMVLDATGIDLQQVGDVDFSSLKRPAPNVLPPTRQG